MLLVASRCFLLLPAAFPLLPAAFRLNKMQIYTSGPPAPFRRGTAVGACADRCKSLLIDSKSFPVACCCFLLLPAAFLLLLVVFRLQECKFRRLITGAVRPACCAVNLCKSLLINAKSLLIDCKSFLVAYRCVPAASRCA